MLFYVCGLCSPCRNQIHRYDFSSSHPIADGFQEPPSCELSKQNDPDVKIYTAKVFHRKVYEWKVTRAQNIRKLACCPNYCSDPTWWSLGCYPWLLKWDPGTSSFDSPTAKFQPFFMRRTTFPPLLRARSSFSDGAWEGQGGRRVGLEHFTSIVYLSFTWIMPDPTMYCILCILDIDDDRRPNCQPHEKNVVHSEGCLPRDGLALGVPKSCSLTQLVHPQFPLRGPRHFRAIAGWEAQYWCSS